MDEDLRASYDAILDGLRSGGAPPFDEVRGRISPYTNIPVKTPEQYDEYLRQYALSLSYLEAQSPTEENNRILSNRLYDTQLLLDNAQKENDRILRRLRRVRTALLIVSAVLLFFVFSLSGWRSESYDAGYSAAASDIESVKEAFGKEQYDSGYAFGYQAGVASVPASTPSPSFSSPPASRSVAPSSRFDFPEPETDTGYYIGNKSSKKFHYPSCSYLPDEKNRIIFNARSDAVSAGYSPCGRCNP